MNIFVNESVSDKPYCVYRLINITKKEIYHGITVNFPKRCSQHSEGDVDATSHWDFEKDTIEYQILLEDLPESEASDYAHAFEHNPHKEFPGYTFIKTSGL